MSTQSRLLVAIVTLALSSTLVGHAHAAPSASIEQVRNGLPTASPTPTPAWVTGNAGGSNSHYLESHSIAYRTVMKDLPTDGTVVELVVAYNVKRSGSYAIDYLTHYQRLLPHVGFSHSQAETFDPLAGTSGVSPTVTTTPIPIPTVNLVVDPDGAESEPAAPQPATNMSALSASERLFTLFGGTLIDASYVTQGDVALATSSSESQVKIRFTATSPTAVLAWGGHIACRWDWGFNADGTPRSAGGISGSSYHMRLVGWNLGSVGNQDRSMSTDAVYPVPRCGISNTGPLCAGTTVTHTAPSGMETYVWTLFDNTSGATIVGSNMGPSVTVSTGAGGSYGLLLSTGASGFSKQCQAIVLVNAPVTADAGADQTVCATSPQVQLAGVATGGTGSWTGGGGTWTPNASSASATYTPSAAEITAGGVTLTFRSTPTGPCAVVSDAMRITIERAATANAGADFSVCVTNPQMQLAGSVGGGATSGAWSGGTGSFSPNASALNAVYSPSAAEIAAGSVTLTLTTNATGGPCPTVNDAITITILPAATANAGADRDVCAASPQVQLAGSVGGGATSGTWSGGTGSFNPGRSALNAVYTPSAAEITAGSVTLTLNSNDPAGPCVAANDAMRITIERAATANAGADLSVCATGPQVQLAGSVGGGATSGAWSGGTGSFNPGRSALNAVYTPSAAEIAAGSVTLTLTTVATGGPCPTASDAITIAILPAATANAGADRDVCAATPQVQLAGSVGGGATSGTWSGGTGSYSPNASALNVTYTPSAAEITAGGVTLTLTTNDPAGPCVATNDAMRITIERAATVNAGADLSVCSTSPQAQLAGSVGGGASSGMWNGGSGSFNPGRSALNAIYTPSAAEIAAGSVTLTLTTVATGGPCPTASDAVTINILPAATANAGADRDVCATSPQVQLAGSVGGGASSGMWSGGAGSFSPSVSALNATYTPSAAEIAAGAVTLTLTTNDPAGPCGAVTDQMRIRIMPIAIVNAGPDFNVCSSSPRVNLQGSVSGGASTGVWSGGAGTFSPSASVLNASYTPSAAEIAAGSVTLTLTSTGNQAPCPPASDQVTILISPAVSANAGPDQIVCPAPGQVRLAGVLGNGATSGTWTGGTGTFVPNASTLDAMYTLSAAEVAGGGVTLTLTTNDPAGPCPPVQDAMRITVDVPRVTVANRTVCEGISPVQMCANASNGVGPYTYLWNNGATTACISAADTGSYTVTITDAKGCQATATGVFRQRECTGMIAHTNVTCASFMDGTGEGLWDDVHWVVQNNVINSISPGVFFYFTKIDAPSSDFVVNIVQTKDNPSFPFCEVQQAQVSLYGADCGNRDDDASTGGGQASVHVTGATPGQVFIISVKYSLKSLVGTYMDETMGCHYDFRTEIAGQVVDGDPRGIQVGVPRPVVEPPLGGNDPGVDPGEIITLHDRPTERPTAPTPPGQNPPPPGGSSDDGDVEAIQRDRPAEPPSTLPPPGGGGGTVSTPVGGGPTSAPGGAETFGRAETESPGAALVLDRPMPNPFSGAMSLAYAVSEDGGAVEIAVYDLAGRRMRTLVSGRGIAGTHRVTWDGRDDSGARVRKGMYFVHVRVGQQARQVRVTFVN